MRNFSTKLYVILWLSIISLTYTISYAQCPVTAFANKKSIICGDSVSLSAIGTPGSYIFDNNFNDGTIGTGWSSTTQATFTNPCSPTDNGTIFLWFGNESPTPRTATTSSYNLSTGGTICFDMRYAVQGDVSPCEGIDLPNEGVYLQYSTDGGANWNTVDYWDPNGGTDPQMTKWNRYCQDIPAGARTANTMIRWTQLNCSGQDYDHWGLENVRITINDPNYKYIWQHTGIESTTSATPKVAPAANTTYTVLYTDHKHDSCYSSVDIIVKLPTVITTKSTDSICPGSSVQLNAISSLIKDLPLTCGLNASGPGCDIHSQAGETTIGTGTIVNSPNSRKAATSVDGDYVTNIVPNIFGDGDLKETSQIIYLASELKAAGFNGGQIHNIAFDISSITGLISYKNFSISIACTDSTSFAKPNLKEFQGSLSQVYAPRTISLSNGRNDFYFDNTFNWDGHSNILVQICFYDKNGGSTLYSAKTKDHATNFNSVISAGLTNGTSDAKCFPAGAITYATVAAQRPNTIFGVCIPKPINLEYHWTPTTGLDNPNIRNPQASPTTTTTYTVQVNEVGYSQCPAYDSQTITVTNPDLSVNPSSANLCAGQSVNLVATASTKVATVKIPTTVTQTITDPKDTIPNPPATGTNTGVNHTITFSGLTPAALTSTSIVSVEVNITHPRISEVSCTLKSPSGTIINLILNRGGNGANMVGTRFSDAAITNISSGSAPFTGSFKPEQPFSLLTGNINGAWILNIKDNVGQVSDGGTPPTFTSYKGKLNSWSITLINKKTNSITSYQWSPSIGLSSTNTASTTANPSSSQTYTVTAKDVGGCATSKTVQVNVGVSNDIPIISSNSPVCEGDSLKLFNTDNIGVSFAWTGPDGFSSTLKNPFVDVASMVNQGDYHLQVTTAAGCLSQIATLTAIVNKRDDAGFLYPSATICETDNTNPKPAIPAGVSGTFSSSPAGLVFLDNSTGEINLSASSIGTYNVTFTTNGSCPSSKTISITISSSPDASFSYSNAAYCSYDQNPLPVFAVGASAGTFSTIPDGLSFVSLSTGEIDLKNSTPGTYQVINRIPPSGSCAAASDTVLVTINGKPDASFTLASSSVCINADKVSLMPIVNGGVFSGKGVTGSYFDPAIAGVGSHIVKYILTVNGCTDSTSQTIIVNSLPNAAFSGLIGPYCASDNSEISLTPNQDGGTFYGDGIDGYFFNPSVAGTGTHTIKYVISTDQGCSDSTMQTVIVNSSPDATFSGLKNEYCINEGSVNLIPNESGGTFFGDGVTGNTFSPSQAGVGQHKVRYVIENSNGCSDSSSVFVTVNSLPDASYSGLKTSYCINGSGSDLTPTTSGGIFSGDGMINGNHFDPTKAGIGSHIIIYKVKNSSGCIDSSSKNVTVNAKPDATFSGLQKTYCQSDPSSTLTPIQTGGIFSGPGITDNIFYPSAAGTGMFTIKYIITNSNGCKDTTAQTVTVNPTPDGTFSGLKSKYCINDADVTMTPATAGGTFSGKGVNGNIFSPSKAGKGTIVIKYVVSNNFGCTDSSSQTVTVNSLPIANAGPDTTLCQKEVVTLGINAIAGNKYKWNPSTGLDDDTKSKPKFTADKPGQTIYTLTVTSAAGCIANDDVTITVNPLPKADFGFSITDKTFAAIGTAENGVYAWEWDFGDRSKLDSTRNPVHTYLQCDFFTVTLKVTSECGKDSISKQIKTCSDTTVVLGLDQANSSFKNSFKVFPNPVSDKLELEFALAKAGKVHLQLYNAIGEEIVIPELKEISTKELSQGIHHYRMNLGMFNLSNGLYMIVLENDGHNYTQMINKIK